jgi:hypothetical protein
MDLHLINRRLVEMYGTDFMNQPIYRVIWSEDQIEKRFSTFKDFLEGTNILLREVTEVREVRKYSYLEPQYVLEKLFWNQHNKEILNNDSLEPSRCTYEPMWCFGYDGKVPKPVIWRAIELIILSINNPKKLTPSQLNDEELEQAKRDELLFMNILNEKIPNDSLHTAVKDGGAVMLGDIKRG